MGRCKDGVILKRIWRYEYAGDEAIIITFKENLMKNRRMKR